MSSRSLELRGGFLVEKQGHQKDTNDYFLAGSSFTLVGNLAHLLIAANISAVAKSLVCPARDIN